MTVIHALDGGCILNHHGPKKSSRKRRPLGLQKRHAAKLLVYQCITSNFPQFQSWSTFGAGSRHSSAHCKMWTHGS
eukprot:2106563-Karenia_brevis.AAC.1